MGRSCYVCNSPNRSEYDKLRLEGMPVKEIWRSIAIGKYNENKLQYHHFQKHFQNHVELLVNETIKANRLRDQVIKEVVKKDIEIVKTFSHNLEMVTDKVDTIVKEMDDLDSIMKYGEMFVKLTTESRMIIEQFLRWSSKLNIQDTSEDVFNTIIKCMYDFPPELLENFAERWKMANESR
jgi:hypothetical protein